MHPSKQCHIGRDAQAERHARRDTASTASTTRHWRDGEIIHAQPIVLRSLIVQPGLACISPNVPPALTGACRYNEGRHGGTLWVPRYAFLRFSRIRPPHFAYLWDHHLPPGHYNYIWSSEDVPCNFDVSSPRESPVLSFSKATCGMRSRNSHVRSTSGWAFRFFVKLVQHAPLPLPHEAMTCRRNGRELGIGDSLP